MGKQESKQRDFQSNTCIQSQLRHKKRFNLAVEIDQQGWFRERITFKFFSAGNQFPQVLLRGIIVHPVKTTCVPGIEYCKEQRCWYASYLSETYRINHSEDNIGDHSSIRENWLHTLGANEFQIIELQTFIQNIMSPWLHCSKIRVKPSGIVQRLWILSVKIPQPRMTALGIR